MPSTPVKPLQAGKSYELRLSPDGTQALALGRNVVLWDVATRKRLASAHPFGHPSSAAFAPDGQRVVVKNTSGEIVVLAVPDLSTLCVADCRGWGEGSAPFWSPCGRFLVDGNWGGDVAVRDASTGAVVLREHYDCSMLHDISANADASLFSFVLFHRGEDEDEDEDEEGGEPKSRSTSVGDTIATRRWPFDQHAARVFQPPRAWSHTEGAFLSPDGTRLAVMVWQPKHKTVLEIHELRDDAAGQVRSLRLDFGATGPTLAWSPDGGTIACIELQRVTLIDVATLKRRASHPLPYASHVEFSRDGRLLAIGSWSKGVVLALEDVGAPT